MNNIEHRVFISAPRDIRLDEPRKKIKHAIVDQIRNVGYEPERFLDSESVGGLAAGAGWSLQEVERVATRCVGAAIIGLPFWKTMLEEREIWLPTDYCPYEGAVAHALGLPILAISIGIEQRGIFHQHARVHAISIPLQEDLSWLQADKFRVPFANWRREIEQRRDVFLGYCSKSAGTAAQIQLRLEKLGATVLNWEMDFQAGNSIIDEIENAKMRCSCGIFLFSEDDPLEDPSGGAAPRDNVVFEAGYFMSAKGADRCLIVRYGEAKMPADVGGAIYVHLSKGADVGSIEGRLSDFLSRNL
jgi:Predicted nucleotide-binding protein containing TIR-like domain